MLMTMTTSKRLSLFRRTLESLDRVGFQTVINRCLIIDDHSTEEDLTEMVAILTKLGVTPMISHNPNESEWRHVYSLNIWLKHIVGEDFVFHCEDDWEFQKRSTPMFQWALNTMAEHEWIGQACFRQIKHRTTRPASSERFWIRTIANCPEDPAWKSHPGHWPSRFTLTPTVTRVKSLEKMGEFVDMHHFEKVFGLEWVEAGWTTVYHPVGFCEHIGEGQSAYDINGSRH